MEHLLQALFGILRNVFVIILIMELIIGNLGNGLLALVNFMDWVKRRKISLVNQIITALATSRIYLLLLLFTGFLVSLLHPDFFLTSVTLKVSTHLWIIAHHFSIWLTTCLSVFYFLKIANSSNSLFLYLKWRVKKAVAVTLLQSLILLLLNVLLANLRIDVWIHESQRNASYSSQNPSELYRRLLGLNITFLSVPIGVTLTSFLLLIFSLWRHHKKRQQYAQGCRDASTTAHIKALQNVISFLLLYSTFIISLIAQFWKYEVMTKSLFRLFCHVVYVAFPSFHPYFLILGDVRLRQAFPSVLWWLRCRTNNMDTSDP